MAIIIPNYKVKTLVMNQAYTNQEMIVNARQIFFNQVPVDITVRIGAVSADPITIEAGETRKIVLCGRNDKVEKIFITASAGSGTLQVYVSEAVDLSGFSGAGGGAGDVRLIHLVPEFNQAEGGTSLNVTDLVGRVDANNVLTETFDADVDALVGSRNGLDAAHLFADGTQAGAVSGELAYASKISFWFRNFFNDHGFTFPSVENIEIILEDILVVSSEVANPSASTNAWFGFGDVSSRQFAGFIARRNSSALWTAFVRDGSTSHVDDDLSGTDPSAPTKLGIGLRLKNGARSMRWYINDVAVKTLSLPFTADFAEGVTFPGISYGIDVAAGEEFTLSALLGRGAIVREVSL